MGIRHVGKEQFLWTLGIIKPVRWESRNRPVVKDRVRNRPGKRAHGRIAELDVVGGGSHVLREVRPLQRAGTARHRRAGTGRERTAARAGDGNRNGSISGPRKLKTGRPRGSIASRRRARSRAAGPLGIDEIGKAFADQANSVAGLHRVGDGVGATYRCDCGTGERDDDCAAGCRNRIDRYDCRRRGLAGSVEADAGRRYACNRGVGEFNSNAGRLGEDAAGEQTVGACRLQVKVLNVKRRAGVDNLYAERRISRKDSPTANCSKTPDTRRQSG